MKFISIVWNYFDSIPFELIKYLNDISEIQNITLMKLDSDFARFVYDIYSIDGIKKEYITFKIEEMERLSSRDILIIYHKINVPYLYYNKDKDCNISKVVELLKIDIRDKFNIVYNCTSSAPIIHSTDNDVETLSLSKIILKYGMNNYTESIKFSF